MAQYIRKEMIGSHPFTGKFDLFAVEGGARRDDLPVRLPSRENHLLKAGDAIALGMPIFTPYVEIPGAQRLPVAGTVHRCRSAETAGGIRTRETPS
ncbi:hypothetical protein ACU4GD_45525 [Cupriavidus basilensis]